MTATAYSPVLADSRRGAIDGLGSAHPIGHMLPALYHDDDLAQRFCAALDEVLAPVLLTLDNLADHLDPGLAPADFLTWIASWVGLAVDESWPIERLRELVANTVDLYRWSGTARGLRGLLEIYTGAAVELTDPGGAAWSITPGGAAPGSATGKLVVRVRPPKGVEVSADRVDALVESAKPAHVPHVVEVKK